MTGKPDVIQETFGVQASVAPGADVGDRDGGNRFTLAIKHDGN